MSHITTHILDAALGAPARSVRVVLSDVTGTTIAEGTTDGDGRIDDLGPDRLPACTYRLQFFTGEYFAATERPTFYPTVSINFAVVDTQQHYHVPLLISPFAYSTYRGS